LSELEGGNIISQISSARLMIRLLVLYNIIGQIYSGEMQLSNEFKKKRHEDQGNAKTLSGSITTCNGVTISWERLPEEKEEGSEKFW